jgi:hypothetical protein
MTQRSRQIGRMGTVPCAEATRSTMMMQLFDSWLARPLSTLLERSTLSPRKARHCKVADRHILPARANLSALILPASRVILHETLSRRCGMKGSHEVGIGISTVPSFTPRSK